MSLAGTLPQCGRHDLPGGGAQDAGARCRRQGGRLVSEELLGDCPGSRVPPARGARAPVRRQTPAAGPASVSARGFIPAPAGCRAQDARHGAGGPRGTHSSFCAPAARHSPHRSPARCSATGGRETGPRPGSVSASAWLGWPVAPRPERAVPAGSGPWAPVGACTTGPGGPAPASALPSVPRRSQDAPPVAPSSQHRLQPRATRTSPARRQEPPQGLHSRETVSPKRPPAHPSRTRGWSAAPRPLRRERLGFNLPHKDPTWPRTP